MEINDFPPQDRATAFRAFSAMKEKKALTVLYHGEKRVIEVHAIGITSKGNPGLRAYQVVGGSVFSDKTGWKLFRLDDLEIVGEAQQSLAPREGFKPHDMAFERIYAEIGHDPPS